MSDNFPDWKARGKVINTLLPISVKDVKLLKDAKGMWFVKAQVTIGNGSVTTAYFTIEQARDANIIERI